MTEQKSIRIALLGLGTVGGGVYKLLRRRAEEMPNIVGTELEITHILVHNLKKSARAWILPC